MDGANNEQQYKTGKDLEHLVDRGLENIRQDEELNQQVETEVIMGGSSVPQRDIKSKSILHKMSSFIKRHI